jgi:hypothetical protein
MNNIEDVLKNCKGAFSIPIFAFAYTMPKV